MYKLTILLFFLITYNSLIYTYHLKFANKDTTYTLQIKKGSLIMNNQPDVSIVVYQEGNNNSVDTDKGHFDSNQETQNNLGKIYKITKGSTFEEGLKIGGLDDIYGEGKIGGLDDIYGEGKMNSLLFGVKDHQAYQIILSYEFITILEKLSKEKTSIPISEDGVYLNIVGDKFRVFK